MKRRTFFVTLIACFTAPFVKKKKKKPTCEQVLAYSKARAKRYADLRGIYDGFPPIPTPEIARQILNDRFWDLI